LTVSASWSASITTCTSVASLRSRVKISSAIRSSPSGCARMTVVSPLLREEVWTSG
jgi:hypothetical protein